MIRSAAATAAALPALVGAAELSGYVVLTTDYVKRGVTQSDGHGAAQIGADVAFDSGVYAGVWASTVDIDHRPVSRRDAEVAYYLGYGKDIAEPWNIGANVVLYSYPGADGVIDYDYVEYAVSVSYDDTIWLEYAYSPNLFDSGDETHNVELYGEWALAGRFDASAGLGYYDISTPVYDGYGYWHLGVTRTFGRFDIDLRYHDTSRWVPIVSSPERADPRVTLSLRAVF